MCLNVYLYTHTLYIYFLAVSAEKVKKEGYSSSSQLLVCKFHSPEFLREMTNPRAGAG